MKTPLVSIITPTYNHEKYIEECIESVLSQTFPDWEQIIIDDASTDRTPEIIEQYAKKDRRIKLIRHKKNYGIYRLADIYNEALNISNGELIAVLEGDDFWLEYKLEKQVPVFDDREVVLSWGKVGVTTEDGKFFRISPKKISKKDESIYNNDPGGNILKILLFQNIIPASTVMIRKSALISIEGFKQPYNLPFVDYPTWLYLSLKGKFYYLDEILGYWRQHSSQVTKTSYFRQAKLNYRLKMIEHFYNSLSYEVKKKVGITDKIFAIRKRYCLAEFYYEEGKIKLKEKKWKSASKKFKKAIILGNAKVSIKAFIGLLITLFKIDLFEYFSILKVNRKIKI